MRALWHGILLLFLFDVFGICGSKSIDKMLPEAPKNIDKDASFNYTVGLQDMDDQIVKPEPDIALTDNDHHHISPSYGRYRRNSVKDPSMLWPRKIPYELKNIKDKWRIRVVDTAMKEWATYTCLEFEPMTDRNKSYVVFYFNPDPKSGCYSLTVGNQYRSRNITEHVINLAIHCFHSTIITHEIGHVIGHYHEHERPDRDEHVTVDYENIEDDWYSQFIKRRANEVSNHGTPYDCSSVMHYSPNAFSRNGLPTITTNDEACRKVMGKATTLSFNDAKQVNSMYSCSRGCGINNCGDESYLDENCECYCASDDRYATVLRCSSREYYTIYVVLERSTQRDASVEITIRGWKKDLALRTLSETALARGIEVGLVPDIGNVQEVKTSLKVDDIRYVYIRKHNSGDEYYGIYDEANVWKRLWNRWFGWIRSPSVVLQKLYNERSCAGDTFTKGRGGYRFDKDDTQIKNVYTADDCKAACRKRKTCKTAFLANERLNYRGDRLPVRCFLGSKGVGAFKFTDSFKYGEIFLRKC